MRLARFMNSEPFFELLGRLHLVVVVSIDVLESVAAADEHHHALGEVLVVPLVFHPAPARGQQGPAQLPALLVQRAPDKEDTAVVDLALHHRLYHLPPRVEAVIIRRGYLDAVNITRALIKSPALGQIVGLCTIGNRRHILRLTTDRKIMRL